MEGTPEKIKLTQCNCLESRLDYLTSAMTSLTERPAGKGSGQAMEYEEQLVHNIPAVAQNAIMSIDKKVNDNILHIMTGPIIVPQPAALQNPVGQPAACFA